MYQDEIEILKKIKDCDKNWQSFVAIEIICVENYQSYQPSYYYGQIVQENRIYGKPIQITSCCHFYYVMQRLFSNFFVIVFRSSTHT